MAGYSGIVLLRYVSFIIYGGRKYKPPKLADFTSTVIFLFSARNFTAPQDKSWKSNLASVGEKSASGGERSAV